MFLLLASLSSCETMSRSGPQALVGAWTNRLGTVLTIRSDGTFDGLASYPRGGKVHVWGNYTVIGDTVTFHGSGGNAPKGCKGPGVYHFQRASEDTLQFAVVKDECQTRMRNLGMTWHRR